jgi:hypothetical protein
MTIVDIIVSEIKRIKDMYVNMDGVYRLSYRYIDRDDLLRADGALMELQELKRKIKEG